jgi:hypothetical protein
LSFRDGHNEQIERYTIAGEAIYTKADYWTTRSWTRKIPINELDIPATLAINRERGTKFRLPSGPNEVVIRLYGEIRDLLLTPAASRSYWQLAGPPP